MYTEEKRGYGSIFLKKDYIECVKSEGFIDYDGFCKAGKLIEGKEMFTEEYFYPSELKKMPEDYEFVQWFNR